MPNYSRSSKRHSGYDMLRVSTLENRKRPSMDNAVVNDRVTLGDITNRPIGCERESCKEPKLLGSTLRPALQQLDINTKREVTITIKPESGAVSCCDDEDIKDIDCHSNPAYARAYARQIYQRHRLNEVNYRPRKNYMTTRQDDINPSMRGILVDWLVEVADEYQLVSDTLYLSVALLDRALSMMSISKSRLQLLGVTCMFIAAKYEEIYAPQVDEFVFVTDESYSREQVLEMERDVLKVLKFELSCPTTKNFLRRYIRAAEADTRTEFLANYFAELALVEYKFLDYLPSQIASASVVLALHTLQKPCWGPTMQHYTGYTPAELEDCIEALHKAHIEATNSQLPAVRVKYAKSRYKLISHTPPAPYPFSFKR